MAFVFKAEKKIGTQKTSVPETIGPGSYISHNDYQIQKSFAPFNTSDIRQEKVKQEIQQIPGPGAYHVEKSNSNEKVVVSSANEDIKIVEVPKNNFVFKSQTNRFQQQKIVQQTPGPGQYVQPQQFQIEKKMQKQQVKNNVIEYLQKQNKYISIPSIPSNMHSFGYTEHEGTQDGNGGYLELNKLPVIIYSGDRGDTVGPGQYDLAAEESKNRKRGVSWGKCSQRTQKQNVVGTNSVGPGQYEVTMNPPLHQNKASSVFASSTNRIFDVRKGQVAQEQLKKLDNQSDLKTQQKDGVKSQTFTEKQELKQGDNTKLSNMPSSALNDSADTDIEDEYEYIDDCTPGPGYYQPEEVVKAINPTTKVYKYQFFGSSQDRFKEKKLISPIGPADYTVNQVGITQKPFQLKSKNPPFLSSNIRFEQKIMDETKPGPGHYDYKQSLEDKLISKIQKGYRGNFGCTEKRFKSMDIIDEQPGPGTYSLEAIQEKEAEDKEEVKDKSTAVFKSKDSRFNKQNKKDQRPPVGLYNVDNYDISKRAKNEDDDDPDLAIKKPGFNSGAPRFQEAKISEVQNEEEDSVSFGKERNIAVLFNKNKNKKNLVKAPFNGKSDRFKYSQKQKEPGPGQYYDTSINPWNKRTYNIQFAEI